MTFSKRRLSQIRLEIRINERNIRITYAGQVKITSS